MNTKTDNAENRSLQSLVRRWSIRNHLGHEVGTVETEHDPIAAYAVNVNAPSARLRAAGYTATEAPNEKLSHTAPTTT